MTSENGGVRISYTAEAAFHRVATLHSTRPLLLLLRAYISVIGVIVRVTVGGVRVGGGVADIRIPATAWLRWLLLRWWLPLL